MWLRFCMRSNWGQNTQTHANTHTNTHTHVHTLLAIRGPLPSQTHTLRRRRRRVHNTSSSPLLCSPSLLSSLHHPSRGELVRPDTSPFPAALPTVEAPAPYLPSPSTPSLPPPATPPPSVLLSWHESQQKKKKEKESVCVWWLVVGLGGEDRWREAEAFFDGLQDRREPSTLNRSLT